MKNIIYNLFRLWESVFGRKEGIRRESLVYSYTLNGRWVSRRTFYTLESRLCWYEALIREMLKSRQFSFEFVRLPALITPDGFIFPRGYRLAIARDSATTASNITFTTSFTATGSGPAIFMGTLGDVGADNQTGSTYNGVSMAKTDSSATSGRSGVGWYLSGTGDGAAHNLVTSGGAYCEQYIQSFSGCKNTGTTPDSHAVATTTAGTTITMTTTVVASNCWLAAYAKSPGTATTYTAGSGTSMRYASTNGGSGDSNGTIGTGSRSLIFIGGTDDYRGFVVSIEPVIENRTLTAGTGAFTFTGDNAVVLNVVLNWTNQSKNSSTFSNQSKNTSTFSNATKSSSTWTNQNKN